jgi:hypothetical protein
MAHACTPGLTVSRWCVVTRRRLLPLRGDVVVCAGDPVEPGTVVARARIPGSVQARDAASDLGVPPSDLPAAMLKREGESVNKDEVVAEQRSFFGVFTARSLAPVSGTVERISGVTGQVLYREPPIPVEVGAYVRGIVTEVLPGQGAVVEARGALVQGIFGIGGESHGPLAVVSKSPDAVLDARDFSPGLGGRILVGGGLVTLAAIREAARLGVRGLIVGGMNDDDLRQILGYELGVAITGHERIGPTLVMTEGFGAIAMARRTFELLAANEGRGASINGTTQIRAGVIRPEVIVPLEIAPPGASGAIRNDPAAMEIGSAVRVIRGPRFGAIGRVTALPPKPAPLETESMVRVVTVDLPGGEPLTLPRANVELIED